MRAKRQATICATALAVLAISAGGSPALAAPPAPRYVEGELIVRYRSGVDGGERAELRRRAGVTLGKQVPLPGVERVALRPGASVEATAARLKSHPEVLYAEPDFLRSLAAPDDTQFHRQWGLHNAGQAVNGLLGVDDADIDAPEAWDLTVGSPSVTVAVVDTGVDMTHRDLQPNAWINQGESGALATNNVDDDRNGHKDDANGWDFVSGDPHPADGHGHGTHVAGTIGARGDNGLGVAGVGWTNPIMPLKVLNDDGLGRTSDIAAAYTYAAANGARIVNASLGGPSFSAVERDAIAAAEDTLFVVAAGNSSQDNDVTPSYPCNHALANVLCVGASDQHDALASFSNHGRASVDLVAPGANVVSTIPGGSTGTASGTSMASPHVAGVAALVLSRRPELTPTRVKSRILEGADAIPGLSPKTVTGARLNALGALTVIPQEERPPSPSPPPPPPPPPAPAEPPAPPQTRIMPDVVAPTASVRLSSSRLALIVRRGLSLSARCSESCRLKPSLTASGASRSRLGRRSLIASRPLAVSAARPARATLKLTAPARRGLGRVRRATVLLSVAVADASGNRRTLRQRVTLKR